MKKLLLSAALLCSLLSVKASNPVLNWAYAIDSKYANDQIGGIVLTSDNKYVSYSHFASQAAGDGLSYAGEVIATGATSSSEGRNLIIIKHDTDGKKLWAVYSKDGYFDAASGSVIATPDGGVLVLTKPRGTQVSATSYAVPVLVDATGAETELSDFPTLNWTYNTVLLKISADGAIEWYREFAMDELPFAGTTKATTDAVTPYGLTVDASGNIYVGGNFRAPIVFTGEKNSHYILQPRNATSNTTSGGLFLVKLDGEGNFVGQVKAEGVVTREQISGLAYADGKIYFYGNVQGAADATLTVGDKSITLENDLDGLFYGAISEDLSVSFLSYVKPFGSTDSKHTTQTKALRVIDGDIYMLGLVKGGFAPAGSASATITSETTTLDRYLIQASGTDGSWKSAAAQTAKVNDKATVSGYFDLFKYNNEVYAYGYALNATLGVFIDKYADNDKFESPEQLLLVTGGGTPTTASGCAFDSNTGNVVVSARGNNTFKFAGSEETVSPIDNKYGAVIASFSLNDIASINQSIAKESTTYSAVTGGVNINAARPLDVNIYNAAGAKVAARSVEAGTTHIDLPQGVYLVNDTKVVVK